MEMKINEKHVSRALEILNNHNTLEEVLTAIAKPGDEILNEGIGNMEMELAFWATFLDVMLHPFAPTDGNYRKRALARYTIYLMALFQEELEDMKKKEQ